MIYLLCWSTLTVTETRVTAASVAGPNDELLNGLLVDNDNDKDNGNNTNGADPSRNKGNEKKGDIEKEPTTVTDTDSDRNGLLLQSSGLL
jgi:hypothetical protein